MEMRSGFAILAGLFIVAGLGGCKLRQPLQMKAHLTQEITSGVDSSPIIRMPVAHYGRCGTTVAIIDVDGLLVHENRTGAMSYGTNPVADFRAKLDYARCHPELGAIVVRINSPGGGVTACDVMWRELQQFKEETGRPVVAMLMDVGTGGSLYLATAADLIVALPTTITGGIGVIFNVYSLEKPLERLGIAGIPVKAGEKIDVGTVLSECSEENRELLQAIADEYQSRFHERLRSSRGKELRGDEAFLDGRILAPSDAIDAGLIDLVGYLDDAIMMAAEPTGQRAAMAVLLHRQLDPADTPYAITPSNPIQGEILPLDIPPLNRPKLPMFLYMWQPNPSYGN